PRVAIERLEHGTGLGRDGVFVSVLGRADGLASAKEDRSVLEPVERRADVHAPRVEQPVDARTGGRIVRVEVVPALATREVPQDGVRLADAQLAVDENGNRPERVKARQLLR